MRLTKCSQCGQIAGSTPKAKYCTVGDEPGGKNEHRYELVNPTEAVRWIINRFLKANCDQLVDTVKGVEALLDQLDRYDLVIGPKSPVQEQPSIAEKARLAMIQYGWSAHRTSLARRPEDNGKFAIATQPWQDYDIVQETLRRGQGLIVFDDPFECLAYWYDWKLKFHAVVQVR